MCVVTVSCLFDSVLQKLWCNQTNNPCDRSEKPGNVDVNTDDAVMHRYSNLTKESFYLVQLKYWLIDCVAMQCFSTQIGLHKCIFPAAVELKHLLIGNVKILFHFWLCGGSHEIGQCKYILSDAVQLYQCGMHGLPAILGLWFRWGMDFHLQVLFMGFLPQNAMTMSIVYILRVLHSEHTFMILCISSLPCLLSHTWSGWFHKVCVFFHHPG